MKRLLIYALLISCTAGAKAGWYSNLYPAHWTPGYSYGTQRYFLHDFSYAGYKLGMETIPVSTGEAYADVTQPPYNADNTGTNDAASAIQNAINAVTALGGGTVYLPAGTYRVMPSGNSALTIRASNIILRGAGKNRTFIRCDEEDMRGKQIILVEGAGNWDAPEDNQTHYLTQDVGDTPAKEIFLDDITGLTIGTWVIIRSDRSAAWIAEHDMNGFWSPNTTMGVTFYRQITALNRDARSITIDIPTRYPVKVRDNARVYKVTPKVMNVGLESFSIGNKMNPATAGWGEEDYNGASTNGGYRVHGAFLIKYRYAVHSWAKNIASYAAGNPLNTSFGEVHMSSNGLDLDKCRSLTIESCDFSYPQYEGGGGNGYGLNLCSEDCLFKYYSSVSPRHAFAFKYAYANGNVFYKCTSSKAKYASDFHMYFSMSNLIDNQILDGDFIESSVRPYGATAGNYHGHTSSQTVFWNSQGIAYKGNNYIVDSRQFGDGYIVGTRGEAAGVKTTPTYISTNYGNVETAPEDYVEGVGQGDDLATPSLYDSQLTKRWQRENTPLAVPAQIEAEAFKHISGLCAEDYAGDLTLLSRTDGGWVEYLIQTSRAGNYRLTLFLSGETPEGAVEIRRGTTLLATITPRPTSGYSDYSAHAVDVDLPEGQQTLRVSFTGSQLNFDRLGIESNETALSPLPEETLRKVYVQNRKLYLDGYADSVDFAVYNTSGQKITANRTAVFPPGLYIVKVQTPQRFERHKIVVN
jgi:hypothetical protein